MHTQALVADSYKGKHCNKMDHRVRGKAKLQPANGLALLLGIGNFTPGQFAKEAVDSEDHYLIDQFTVLQAQLIKRCPINDMTR
ncbi:MAG: hypothetical protein J2P37_09515 [Ktedonobacteraceae bacterium]|nr:hypothetical protein [Ktedonobacteraceae bacterium]